MTNEECNAAAALIGTTRCATAYRLIGVEGQPDADYGWYLKVLLGPNGPGMLLHSEFLVLDYGVAELLARTVDVENNWQFWINYTPGTEIPEEMLHSIA